MLAIFNGNYGTALTEFPDTVFFTVAMRQYATDNVDSYVRWGGKELTNLEKINLGTTLTYIPDIIVLGEKPEEAPSKVETTEAPVTEAPATEEPTTEAPVTETEEIVTEVVETEAVETVTEAVETEVVDAKTGCGSSIGLAGIVLVATLGTCTVAISKKRKRRLIRHI